MKQAISSLFLLLVLISSLQAQNIPLAGSPSGGNANIPLPDNYNSSGNTQPVNLNYTRSWIPARPSTVFSLPVNSVFTTTTTTYTNGFGQPLQSNVDLPKDLVTVYDNRPMLNQPVYLPYVHTTRGAGFRAEAFTEQKSWYDAQYSAEGDNAYNRAQPIYNGNLRTTVSYAPGAAFTGSDRGTTTYAEPVNIGDGISIVHVNASSGLPQSAGVYATGELIVKTTEGQHGTVNWVYMDRNGKTICKRVETGTDHNSKIFTTYYVYDDFGRIAWIVTPKAFSIIGHMQWTGVPGDMVETVLNSLCYHYVYNKYGELIERSVPDKTEKEYTVYDAKHRPILTQTPLLKDQGKWAFQVYDNQSRIVFSGLVTSNISRQGWQDIANETNTTTYTLGTLEYYIQHECISSPNYYPQSMPGCEMNQYSYYDDYAFEAALPQYRRTFSTIHNADFYNTTFHVTPTPVSFVRGLLTGTRTRVLGTNPYADQWTNTVIFYDVEGRPIQTQSRYPWNNANDWDIASTQYTFRGQVARTILTHNAPTGFKKGNSTSTGTKIMVTRAYEPGGLNRLQTVVMNLDGGPPVRLSLYDYDDLGRVKLKDIGNSIEKQYFTYNIRGQLVGINAAYVFDHHWPDATFGCQLTYDHSFTEPRFDGTIAGMIWRGAGSGSQPRAYGYNYDKGGRMTSADFTELKSGWIPLTGMVWYNTDLDYSVSNITYDENGNMQTMKQRGMVPGITNPMDIDDLNYSYKNNSNQLDQVQDGISVTPTTNAGWGLGDFVDRNQNGTDYQYDADGNLTADANKNITSIIYNAQDLPLTITSGNGDNVENIYDASGILLQKTVTANNVKKTYQYCGPLVYENGDLSHVLHEEGRARWLPDSLTWRYDFFIKDHLGNVRSTITWDNGRVSQYLATHELANTEIESHVFTLGNTEPKPYSGSISDLKAVRMNGSETGKEIGTSLMLKVMAGDKFTASAEALYDTDSPEEGEGASPQTVLSTLTTALSGGITSLGSDEGMTGEIMGSMFSSTQLADAYGTLMAQATDPNQPKAYLSWILFDENMNVIREKSSMQQVSAAHMNQWGVLQTGSDIEIDRNGYLVVFTSNHTPRDVFMDNLHVTYSRGKLLEEQHYYPHGLVIRGGSHTPLVNRYLYQGKELQDELGLQLYDFHARQYDPQIGRFWGIDPMDQFPSGYTGMGNDPGNQIDPTGCQTTGGGGPRVDYNVDRNNPFNDGTYSTRGYNTCFRTRSSEYNDDVFDDEGGGGGGGGSKGSDDSPAQGDGDATDVYTTQGQRVGRIDDKLPNQVHFVPGDVANLTALVDYLNSLLQDQRDALTATLRSINLSYIGAEGATQLKDMAMNDVANGAESGYYVSSGKGLNFTTFPNQTNNTFNSTDFPGIMESFSGKASSTFALGHSHVAWWNAPMPGSAEPAYNRQPVSQSLPKMGRPTGDLSNPVDYQNFIRSRDRTLMLINSPVGITIYSAPLSSPTYIPYNWFYKNK